MQLNLRKINLPFSKRLKIIAIQVSESEPKIYNHGNNQINEQSYVPSEMKTRPPQPQNETINVKYWQTSCPLLQDVQSLRKQSLLSKFYS